MILDMIRFHEKIKIKGPRESHTGSRPMGILIAQKLWHSAQCNIHSKLFSPNLITYNKKNKVTRILGRPNIYLKLAFRVCISCNK